MSAVFYRPATVVSASSGVPKGSMLLVGARSGSVDPKLAERLLGPNYERMDVLPQDGLFQRMVLVVPMTAGSPKDDLLAYEAAVHQVTPQLSRTKDQAGHAPKLQVLGVAREGNGMPGDFPVQFFTGEMPRLAVEGLDKKALVTGLLVNPKDIQDEKRLGAVVRNLAVGQAGDFRDLRANVDQRHLAAVLPVSFEENIGSPENPIVGLVVVNDANLEAIPAHFAKAFADQVRAGKTVKLVLLSSDVLKADAIEKAIRLELKGGDSEASTRLTIVNLPFSHKDVLSKALTGSLVSSIHCVVWATGQTHAERFLRKDDAPISLAISCDEVGQLDRAVQEFKYAGLLHPKAMVAVINGEGAGTYVAHDLSSQLEALLSTEVAMLRAMDVLAMDMRVGIMADGQQGPTDFSKLANLHDGMAFYQGIRSSVPAGQLSPKAVADHLLASFQRGERTAVAALDLGRSDVVVPPFEKLA
jgi:hypothetical protein